MRVFLRGAGMWQRYVVVCSGTRLPRVRGHRHFVAPKRPLVPSGIEGVCHSWHHGADGGVCRLLYAVHQMLSLGPCTVAAQTTRARENAEGTTKRPATTHRNPPMGPDARRRRRSVAHLDQEEGTGGRGLLGEPGRCHGIHRLSLVIQATSRSALEAEKRRGTERDMCLAGEHP